MSDAQLITILVTVVLGTVGVIWRQHAAASKTREELGTAIGNVRTEQATTTTTIVVLQSSLADIHKRLDESRDHREELWHEIKALRETCIRLESELSTFRAANAAGTSPGQQAIAALAEMRKQVEALEAELNAIKKASKPRSRPRKKV